MLTGMTEAMPDFMTLWICLGVGLINMAWWYEAEATTHRTLAIATENPSFLSLLPQGYVGQGRYEEGTAVAGRLAALGRTRSVSPTARAIADLRNGDRPAV